MLRMLRTFMRIYSAKKFLGYFGTLGRRMNFLQEAVILVYCLRDPRTPRFIRLVIIGAIGYLLTPVDLIPDVIIGLGWLDDATVVAGAMRLARKYILPEHVASAKRFIPFGG